MKPEHIIALYQQAMLDLEHTSVGFDFTDERRLDRRGRGYVPCPNIRPFLNYEKRHPSKVEQKSI